MSSTPTLREACDNATASLETVMLAYGSQMPEADQRGRDTVIAEARAAIAAHDKAEPGRDALAEFGLEVLHVMTEDTEWSSDTLDIIDEAAKSRGLARTVTDDESGESLFKMIDGLPESIQGLPTLDARELGSILAGLRMLQLHYDRSSRDLPNGLNEIATDGGTVEALDQEEIDALCERLNT